MGILSNVTNWASDVKDKVSSAVSNATSSIGTWLNDTYNNAKTASVISTPSTSTNTSSSSTTTNSTGSSSIYDSTNKTTTTPTQYSSLAAYETAEAKTTAIENIQKSLNTLGYKDTSGNELIVDGIMGSITQANWDNFISDLGVENYLSGIATGATDLYNNAKQGAENLVDNIKLGYNKLKDNEVISESVEAGILAAVKSSQFGPLNTLYEVNSTMENYAAETGQTIILGLTGSVALGAGVSISVGYAVSPDGDKGYVVSGGGGGGTPNLFSGGLFVTSSTAKEIGHLDSTQLEDLMLATGGSVGLPIGPSVGYEYGYGKFVGDDNYDSYNINNNTGSLTASLFNIPVEMHGNLT